MADDKKHESPEVIEAYLNQCLESAGRLCLHCDARFQVHGLGLLRQLFRARRSGRMTAVLEKKYEGLLKSLRPHIAAMSREGLAIPAVVEAVVKRVRAKSKGASV